MKVDDFRLTIGGEAFVPLVIGGMGVNISTAELALEGARLGGIGHLSDAGVCAVADQRFGTDFVRNKRKRCRSTIGKPDKSEVQFDLDAVAEAQRMHVGRTMEAKRGEGAIFINCMEKLTMNDAQGTLRARLVGAMEGGIDGITLSAGLHLKSLILVQDHPRFHDVKFGIIVSSARALKLFLRSARRVKRAPDYIIVEGPLAGGHLGFGADDWHEYDLHSIVRDVLAYSTSEGLGIPVIPAGGVFTGGDAVTLLELGAAGVQVATRFAITEESGLPDDVKQEYFRADEQDVVVNMASPTGYAMRMLRQTPALNTGRKPNCEGLGYILDGKGDCPYVDAYYQAGKGDDGKQLAVKDKICICSEMVAYRCWTCGHIVYRLKDTTHRLPDGSYQQLTAEHVFADYQFSEDGEVRRPPEPDEAALADRDRHDARLAATV